MYRRRCLFVLVAALTTGCVTSPTEDEIDSLIEAQLRSAAGPWTGASQVLTLSFQVSEAPNGALTGSGTMSETSAAGTVQVPITVTGSYSRPNLTFAFMGMVRGGQPVRGDVSGQYTSVGGVSATLVLSGVNGSTYSEQVPVLLQEVTTGG